MRHLYEPGELISTVSIDGKLANFTVSRTGNLVPWDTPIETLGLSVRAYNVLKREGVNSVDQLIEIYQTEGPDGFAKMRNMGQKACDEVVGHIHQRIRKAT